MARRMQRPNPDALTNLESRLVCRGLGDFIAVLAGDDWEFVVLEL